MRASASLASLAAILLLVACDQGQSQSAAVAPIAGAPDPANEPVVKVVQAVLPAVVNISTEKVVYRRIVDPVDRLYFEFFGQPYYGRRIAQKLSSLGSGFFVSPDGYILTNEHVVERAAARDTSELTIRVTLADGSSYLADYIDGDPDRDLALLRIVKPSEQGDLPIPAEFPFIDLDAQSPNFVGQSVVALGNPIGYHSSVSSGILSGKDREVGRATGLLQTDAAINPGNSGGPLVDLAGRLVGVNSMKISYTLQAPTDNIAFAIPAGAAADWAKNAIAIAKGLAKRPPPADPADILRSRFGLDVQDLNPDLATRLGFPVVEGLLINHVEPDSPAAQARVEPGMLVLRIGSYATSELAALPPELSTLRPGDTVPFVLATTLTRGRTTFRRSFEIFLQAR